MLSYCNIRDLAYFTKKSILFLAVILIFLLSVSFQYSERRPIHYPNDVETWVSNLKCTKFFKDEDWRYRSWYDLITYTYIQNGGYQPCAFLKNVDIILDTVIMLAKCKDNQNLRANVD